MVKKEGIIISSNSKENLSLYLVKTHYNLEIYLKTYDSAIVLKQHVMVVLDDGKSVTIKEISIQGAGRVKNVLAILSVFIYIVPPSLSELSERL